MSKCKCCNQEITTAGCGCDVKLANEGLKDYARLLALEDEAQEILVPLDLSDAIALIDRQEQQIVKLRTALAAKEKQAGLYLRTNKGHLNTILTLNKQIASLTAEIEELKHDQECSCGAWETCALRGKEVRNV